MYSLVSVFTNSCLTRIISICFENELNSIQNISAVVLSFLNTHFEPFSRQYTGQMFKCCPGVKWPKVPWGFLYLWGDERLSLHAGTHTWTSRFFLLINNYYAQWNKSEREAAKPASHSSTVRKYKKIYISVIIAFNHGQGKTQRSTYLDTIIAIDWEILRKSRKFSMSKKQWMTFFFLLLIF